VSKYIFITGGVMSSLGKGVTSASLAKLLQLSGLKVSCAKIDPYINVDAGTMNPIAHGEVFVTTDGGETDMDLGNYERFLNIELTKNYNITTGQIYDQVIKNERAGKFLGKCVQIIPHITNEIKNRIKTLAHVSGVDILLVECGGTVGDIEGLPFLEAISQMRMEEKSDNTLFIHVTYAPIIEAVGELKTKPTQHSVQELRRIGIQPDILIIRSIQQLSKAEKTKISTFTGINMKHVISNSDVKSIYNVPLNLQKQNILSIVFKQFSINNTVKNFKKWETLSKKYENVSEVLKIAMVGKYISLKDSYVSVNEALSHASVSQNFKLKVDWLDSEIFEKNKDKLQILNDYHGVILPGGFGVRGSEGKILVANYCRINKIPYLGICFGFQLALVSYLRHACGIKDANSIEINPKTSNPVIHILPEQNDKKIGGTMRLGNHKINLVKNTTAYNIYGKQSSIFRRHRHRYEFNTIYKSELKNSDLILSGFSDNNKRAEILEIKNHPFYFAVQYHPEFNSTPEKSEELYYNFIKYSIKRKISL